MIKKLKDGGMVVIGGFNKVIYGKGSKYTILNHVKIVAKNGSFYFKWFKNVNDGNEYNLYNPNNVDVKVLSRKGAAVANALLTSLRNAKVIAP